MLYTVYTATKVSLKFYGYFVLCQSMTESTMMDVSSQSQMSFSDTDTEMMEISESSDIDETGIQLIAKKNTTSVVWKYFGFVPDEDENVKDKGTPKCTLCFSNVTARWSNIMNHLQIHHPKVYAEVKHAQSLSKEAITTSRPRA